MIDPEAFEPTEEQFASSVSADLEPDAHHHARLRYCPPVAGHEAAAPVRTGSERELGERAPLESGLQAKADVWRQEVADRVEGYRTKRSKKRLAGEFSMKLDFGPPIYTSALPVLETEPETPEFADDQLDAALAEIVPEEMAEDDDAENGSEYDGAPHLRSCAPALNADLAPEASDPGRAAPALAEAAVPWEQVEPEPSPMKRPGPRTLKLIEFPRLAIFPEFEDPYALAEPVLDKPRILDVPEEVPSEPQPFSDVELGPDEEEEAQPAIELPLQVAAVPQRLMAAFVDMALALQATAIFAAIVFWFGVDVPHTKPAFGIAATIPVLFWALYQYLFLVYAAATPGMKMARLGLSTFDGAPVPRRLRRLRALMLVLSGLSLALGFIWAFFDEDTLGWHDKMTRTYLIMR